MHLAALHTPSQIQLNKAGNLKHFLTIEGLSKRNSYKNTGHCVVLFNDQNQLITNNLLEGKTVMNLFLKILPERVLHLRQRPNVCLPTC